MTEADSKSNRTMQGFDPRSPGSKLFLLVILALVMSLAGIFVDGLTSDRADSHHLLAALSDEAVQQPSTVLGIRLVDSYRATDRSLHYIPLFLGLVFVTYFLFEVKTQRKVHPAQYVLVGIAQVIFYLLLLSLAEHVGFDLSFLIAGACTVALLSLNANWVFESRQLGWQAAAAFTLLYSFIYVLLRIEVYALIVGAFTSFAAISAAMYVTRRLDWYGVEGTKKPAKPKAAIAYESWLD